MNKVKKRMRQHTKEKELWVDGGFMSEKHMTEVLHLSSRLAKCLTSEPRAFASGKG